METAAGPSGDDLRRSLGAASAFDACYGLELLGFDEEGARARMPVAAHVLQSTGVVHGGVFASIAESLASMGTNWHVTPTGHVGLGMSNATSFLRPVASGHVDALARPIHRGRMTWVWDVELSDASGRLCATSRVTVAVRPLASGR